MLSNSLLAAAGLLALTNAQTFPIPDLSGDVFCDGTVRPDYSACDDLIPETFDNAVAGPGFNEGTTWTNDGCQLRYIRCAGPEGSTFESDVSADYPHIKRQCAEFPAGGIFRWGDGCVVVQTEDNPLAPDNSAQATKREVPERESKLERRELVASLDERQTCPTVDCYEYTEQVFIDNVRGLQERVCDNILPDGARCDKTKSVTVTDTYTVEFGVEASVIKDVISASASFSYSESEAVTESLTTAITVNCDGRSGYIVWYPLMQVSRGECRKGTSSACNGVACFSDEVSSCEMRVPIVAQDGKLSGEYDVQCI
ncbi:uncharacterized protein F5Z01DRAFT_668282 [Emericellopsis atlantica]|uniref:Uncharacterized protein n=1 Tax=Emericellopsis atlantica TaxID=2614577 RepID=A0A9P8CLM3_9HYPO|nr:uncharacterized protein F5Z01DRAFT_668282 [Emericellopsis atlantica]KAG9249751.1 hypothetical protein F5Z01DRAFT_668282 [Emericellopsis atlantica]